MVYQSMEVQMQRDNLARCILRESTYMFDDAARVMEDFNGLPQTVTDVVIDASRVTGYLSTEVLDQFGHFALTLTLRGGRLSIDCAGNEQVGAHIRKFHSDLCPGLTLLGVADPAHASRFAA